MSNSTRIYSKLTLSINQFVIDEAKRYAKSSGRSLSSIVEEYLRTLAQAEKSNKTTATLEIVEELKGAVKLPMDFTSYKEILQEALLEKYLSK